MPASLGLNLEPSPPGSRCFHHTSDGAGTRPGLSTTERHLSANALTIAALRRWSHSPGRECLSCSWSVAGDSSQGRGGAEETSAGWRNSSTAFTAISRACLKGVVIRTSARLSGSTQRAGNVSQRYRQQRKVDQTWTKVFIFHL